MYNSFGLKTAVIIKITILLLLLIPYSTMNRAKGYVKSTLREENVPGREPLIRTKVP